MNEERHSDKVREDEELLLEQKKITEVLFEKRRIQEDEACQEFEEHMRSLGSTKRRLDSLADNM